MAGFSTQLIGAAFCIGLAAAGGIASACRPNFSAPIRTHLDKIEIANTIVVARALSSELSGDFERVMTFETIRVERGAAEAEIRATTTPSSASCGVDVHVGRVYVILKATEDWSFFEPLASPNQLIPFDSVAAAEAWLARSLGVLADGGADRPLVLSVTEGTAPLTVSLKGPEALIARAQSHDPAVCAQYPTAELYGEYRGQDYLIRWGEDFGSDLVHRRFGEVHGSPLPFVVAEPYCTSPLSWTFEEPGTYTVRATLLGSFYGAAQMAEWHATATVTVTAPD